MAGILGCWLLFAQVELLHGLLQQQLFPFMPKGGQNGCHGVARKLKDVVCQFT